MAESAASRPSTIKAGVEGGEEKKRNGKPHVSLGGAADRKKRESTTERLTGSRGDATDDGGAGAQHEDPETSTSGAGGTQREFRPRSGKSVAFPDKTQKSHHAKRGCVNISARSRVITEQGHLELHQEDIESDPKMVAKRRSPNVQPCIMSASVRLSQRRALSRLSGSGMHQCSDIRNCAYL
ncbi:hypothetical protein NDU88_007394 [Pleurodeles waltl]|uniref:Uncharacterized protein n=1 Tax=Pleurodeles waltl TaxID=8319 RepID=A0AAV7MMU5_PLEWA|nr:hypothetical protein NDU88_007394 [Pleurodeles waltl]